MLPLLERESFDLILMDIQMPHISGLETVKRIRNSNKAYANIPIVALTAHALSGDREHFLASGMDGYLAKPVEMSQLKAIIEQALQPRMAASS